MDGLASNEGATLEGGFDTAPIQATHAFRAAMECMARPGRIDEVEGGQVPAPLSVAASVLLLTLCDSETPVFLGKGLDIPHVRGWVTFHTGAPLVGADQAMFGFGCWQDLLPLDRFALGTQEYPDRSATLIVELGDLSPEGAVLTGPGIKDQAMRSLPDLEVLQNNARQFPLGLGFFFTSGTRLAALPRSTQVR